MKNLDKKQYRYERKFRIGNGSSINMKAIILNNPGLFSEIYRERNIHNIYLDTEEYQFFQENIAGISERKKIRIRWYGKEHGYIKPSLEIKQKSGLVGTKYVFSLPEILLNGNVTKYKLQDLFKRSNSIPIISITGTLFAYFAIVLLTFGDFSRYSMNYKEMTKGNLSIILNLIFFSFFSVLITLGSDIILTSKGLNASSLLTNPNDIVGKFNNNFLTFFCLIFIIISSLSTNLIANYIPSQNTLINFFPNSLTLKKTGIVISIIGLIISTFWLSIFSKANVLIFVEAVATTFGPIFGVLVADYYLFKKQQINHKELFYPKEHTEYIYSNGWNLKALYALLIGSIFSLSSLLNENLIQYQSFGWIIGAFASYLVYYLLNNK